MKGPLSSPSSPASHPSHALSRRKFIRLAAAGAAAGGLPWTSLAQTRPSAEPRPLGVALLGLGRYSTGELGPALLKTRRCRLAGVVTGHPEKAAQWAREYKLPARNLYSYDTFDRIADNPDVDIVYVVTPPALHREFVVRAARAGKHVISEKPLATTVEDCEVMIAACRQAKVRFSVGYRLHFDPYHRELARLARDRDFGVLSRMTGDRGFVFGQRAWRIDKRLAGGGPMMDLGIYIIHGACMAQDGASPVSVTAQELPKQRPELFNEVEESMRWTMTFSNGAVLDAVSSFNHSSDTFRAEGDRGWIDFQQHAFTYRGIRCVTSRGPLDFTPPCQQALMMDDFAECIATGRPTQASGELGLRDIRILTAIYQAASSGATVTV